MSSFAWLDYSEHDRRVALDVIDQFREQDTRDELGLGAIRDGLADLFFPGTGTVQTRARYFFFVPWIYKRLERARTPSAEIRLKARRAEGELINALLASGEQDGVIGRLRKDNLKRLPSAIYWQGLGQLGILRLGGSQEQYHRYLDRYYKTGGITLRSDDGELLDRLSAHNWHPALPPIPKDFPRGVTLALTREEGTFLRERITEARPNSLLRFLADLDAPPYEADFPWESAALAKVPRELAEQLLHARNFSEVMHGAAILYNLLLARVKGKKERIEHYENMFADWRRLMRARQEPLRGWERTRFWSIVRQTGANVSTMTRRFCDEWIDQALGPGNARLASSEKAEQLIRSREMQLKGAQARVRGGRPLELWSGASGTRRLNYRWPIASRILADMHTAFV